MPLHTDYRPNTLKEFVGNVNTVNALEVHLDKKSPNRSLLFVGPSGCGKTSLAMCVANHLICKGDDKDSDRLMWNFQMLNASDFRGIDTVRDVRERSQRRPLGEANARIWLFDEAHQISKDGQEALLKLLEEPPRDCWFMLATTNPEKLKTTLKRRCTEFLVNTVSDKELTQLLFKVVRSERKRIPNEVMSQIVTDSLGAPGMALNVLDKVIDLPVEDMLSSAKKWAERSSNVITLCRALMSDNWKDILSTLNDLQEEDPEGIRRAVLEYFNKVGLGGNRAKAFAIGSAFEMADCYRNGKWALYSACCYALSK